MRTTMRIPILMLILAAIVISACNNGKATKPGDAAAPEPASLQGASVNWKVTVNYAPAGNKLQEIVTIQSNVAEPLEAVTVTVVHENGAPLVNQVVAPELLKQGNVTTLDKKGEVESWKHTQQAEIEWKAYERINKEYITLEHNADTAPAK